jgi:hypothetical protein
LDTRICEEFQHTGDEHSGDRNQRRENARTSQVSSKVAITSTKGLSVGGLDAYADLKIARSVKFAGPITDQKLYFLYRDCSVAVMSGKIGSTQCHYQLDH